MKYFSFSLLATNLLPPVPPIGSSQLMWELEKHNLQDSATFADSPTLLLMTLLPSDTELRRGREQETVKEQASPE